MKKVISKILLCAVVATSGFAAYPSKTIKLIVPSKAGVLQIQQQDYLLILLKSIGKIQILLLLINQEQED